jgi:heat shock protein HslJ
VPNWHTARHGHKAAPARRENLLQGAAWRVIAIDDELVAEDAIGTIEFFADGLVAGQAFCNRFSGRHALSGEGLRIGPLASTRMACSEPLMTLEKPADPTPRTSHPLRYRH